MPRDCGAQTTGDTPEPPWLRQRAGAEGRFAGSRVFGEGIYRVFGGGAFARGSAGAHLRGVRGAQCPRRLIPLWVAAD